jgi:hypothetical protein
MASSVMTSLLNRESGCQYLILFYQFKITRLPGLVEPGLERAIEA